MLFWFLFCDDIPGYVKFCDDNLCDDILISLWWYCGDVVIQPQKAELVKKFNSLWCVYFHSNNWCWCKKA